MNDDGWRRKAGACCGTADFRAVRSTCSPWNIWYRRTLVGFERLASMSSGRACVWLVVARLCHAYIFFSEKPNNINILMTKKLVSQTSDEYEPIKG
jgi:hypothetical protein